MESIFFPVLFIFAIAWIYRKELTKKYSDFTDLNKLVATRDTNKIRIFWVSLCMVAKMYWLRFILWANDSVRMIDKRTAEISYFVNRKQYKIVVQIDRGPCPILLVMDEKGADVTPTILPYLGPANNWHGRQYFPDFWGKDELTFELSSGEQRKFTRNEAINLC